MWTPEFITTALWLDAADSDTISLISGAVSQWSDKSGNGRHATQDVSGDRPTMSTLSGKGVVNTATNKYLKHPLAKSLFRNCSHAIVGIVYNTELTDFGLYGGFAFANRYINSSNLALRYQAFANSSGKISFFSRRLDNDSGPASIASSINANTTFRVYTSDLAWSSGYQEHFVDGASAGTANYDAAGNTSNTDLADTGDQIWMAVGANAFGSAITPLYLNGKIAEIAVLTKSSGTYTASDRQQLEGYLAHKFGLSTNLQSGHPYKNYAPRA